MCSDQPHSKTTVQVMHMLYPAESMSRVISCPTIEFQHIPLSRILFWTQFQLGADTQNIPFTPE
jgi:hypothetical protein